MKKIFLLLVITISLYANTQTIVFGAGCFWGVEKHFTHLDGVVDAKSGYAGGNYKNPTYQKVLDNRRVSSLNFKGDGVLNHTEVVQVKYNSSKVSTLELIKSFWELHDPTQGDRQGNDTGNNYRSVLYYTNDEQRDIALKTKDIYQKLLTAEGYGKITTEIKKLNKFYDAEKYHQDYLAKNPNGYCPNHSSGVKFTKVQQSKSKLTPLEKKEIIVIEAEHCPFCEKFKKDVLNNYNATLKLRVAKANELNGFKLKSKIFATPTILFIEDGVEKFSNIGYMDEKSFYKAVGAFKLGKESEGYDVAFKNSTDRRFCKQYDKFKHTPDGVFIDKISGDILFDTRDRFNSGSGWLSFFKAVDGSIVEKEDNAYGMKRVEIIAKKSGAHLGHVFNDAPGGKMRFCINATVLEFIAREDIGK